MGPFKISSIGAVVLAASLAACASSSPPKANAPEPESATPSVHEGTTTTQLTSGSVSSTTATAVPIKDESAPPSRGTVARWTDGEIVAALASAQGTEGEIRALRDKSKSARVDRLATQMLFDQRELTSGQASLARRIPGQQSDMSRKLSDAHQALWDAIASNAPSGYDRRFLDAEMAYCKTLIDAIDNEMLPSVRSAELKSYLQTVRSKMEGRLLRAQEIDAQMR